jgi:hypothetical protein
MSFLFGVFVGLFVFIGYVAYRAMRSDGWDDSNITNVLRLLSHVALHPEDFGKMQYKDGSRPFWYISEDEFEDVVMTRPRHTWRYDK